MTQPRCRSHPLAKLARSGKVSVDLMPRADNIVRLFTARREEVLTIFRMQIISHELCLPKA